MRVDGASEFVCEVRERRMRCCLCRARWTHSPEGITSRAHYQPCVVSHAIATLGAAPAVRTTSAAREAGCVASTVRRWVTRIAALAEPAALASVVVAEAGEPVLPKVPVELTPSPRSGHLRALVLRAVTVLVLLEALASLRGLAPPALAHAVALIPANAPSLVRPRDPPRAG